MQRGRVMSPAPCDLPEGPGPLRPEPKSSQRIPNSPYARKCCQVSGCRPIIQHSLDPRRDGLAGTGDGLIQKRMGKAHAQVLARMRLAHLTWSLRVREDVMLSLHAA